MLRATPTSPAALLQLFDELSDARGLVLAPNTHIGYANDWKYFERWCKENAVQPLPAETRTVALYLAAVLLRGKAITTAERFAAGIAHKHRNSQLASPVTPETYRMLAAAKRLFGHNPRKMLPLAVDHVRTIMRVLRKDGSKKAMRDRALIPVGFTSALRGASLSVLEMRDLTISLQGATLRIRTEKQDKQGKGRNIAIPRGTRICAVRALEDWLEIRGDDPGVIFPRLDWRVGSKLLPISPQHIALIVKDAMRVAGFDPKGFAAHSMRAGFVTAAGEAGAGELLIAAQTGHRSMEVLREYFRHYDLFRANPCRFLGL